MAPPLNPTSSPLAVSGEIPARFRRPCFFKQNHLPHHLGPWWHFSWQRSSPFLRPRADQQHEQTNSYRGETSPTFFMSIETWSSAANANYNDSLFFIPRYRPTRRRKMGTTHSKEEVPKPWPVEDNFCLLSQHLHMLMQRKVRLYQIIFADHLS